MSYMKRARSYLSLINDGKKWLGQDKSSNGWLKRLKSALIIGGRKRIQAEWAPYFEKDQTVRAFTQKLNGALPQRH